MEVDKPADLLSVPSSLMHKEYVGLILRGGEDDIIRHAIGDPVTAKVERRPAVRMGPITVESKRVAEMKNLLHRFERGLMRAEHKQEDFSLKEMQIKKDISACVRVAVAQNKEREVKRKAALELSPTHKDFYINMGFSSKEKLTRIHDSNRKLNKNIKLVIKRKAESFDSKIKRIDFITKLRKPDTDIEQKAELQVNLANRDRDIRF